MKAVKKATVMFLIMLCFVVVNGVVLSRLFNSMQDMLDTLPKTISQVQSESQSEHKEHEKTLSELKHKWKKFDTYVSITLNHSTAGEFSDSLMPLIKAFESGDYETYVEQLSQTVEILSRIKKNESFTLGTMF